MNKITIKKLGFNNREIEFHCDENYIIGHNGGGKTTLFSLMQYLLGLKSVFRWVNPLLGDSNPYIECLFGDKLVRISRNFDSKTIIFESNNSMFEAKEDSMYLGEIYNDLLQPKLVLGEDKKAGIDILKTLFVTENSLYSTKIFTESIKKILGISMTFIDEIKSDILKFKKDIEVESFTMKSLQAFIKEVQSEITENKNIKLEADTINYIIDLLNQKYLNVYEKTFQNTLLLNNAKDAYEKSNMELDYALKKRIKGLRIEFEEILYRFDYMKDFNIEDIFYSRRDKRASIGQIVISNFLLLLILCRHDINREYNSCGLIVNDSLLSVIDLRGLKLLREIIWNQSNLGGLQYIEFCSDKADVPQSKIICNLGAWRV